jgi:hypothetical protein
MIVQAVFDMTALPGVFATRQIGQLPAPIDIIEIIPIRCYY